VAIATPRSRTRNEPGLRTVAGDATKAEGLTGSTNKGELIRWWQDHERAWARWWLDQLGIDPQDLIA
jgi:hypothetical protein